MVNSKKLAINTVFSKTDCSDMGMLSLKTAGDPRQFVCACFVLKQSLNHRGARVGYQCNAKP